MIVSCTLTTAPYTRGRAQGLAGAPRTPVTAAVRHRFDKHGKARLTLRLNKAGEQLLTAAGSLGVAVKGQITDGSGRTSTVVMENLLAPRR